MIKLNHHIISPILNFAILAYSSASILLPQRLAQD